MIKVPSLLAVTALCFIISGCQDDTKKPGKQPTLEIETVASAKPVDDAKSSGVYKGSFVGSSGYFKIVLEAGNIKGILMLDGTSYQLTTNDITDADLGKAISNAVFKDASNTIVLTFSVDADGENASIDLQITGHESIEVSVLKEKSDAQVRIYEGFEYSPNVENDGRCKTQISLVLGADSVALMVYKVVDGSTGTCKSGDGRIQFVYAIQNGLFDAMWYSPNWLFSNEGYAQCTDDEIYSLTAYPDDNYYDSTRLARKL
jgi:hypothetical protein